MPFPWFSFFLQGKAMDFTSTTKTNTNMAFSQQTKHLSTTKILSEAIKLPTKSTTLILPILLLSFLASTILFVFVYLTINPVTADLTANSLAIASLDPKSPEYASIQSAILNDFKELLGIEAIFIVFAFIISSLITISTINAFVVTFNSKLLTFTDLLYRVRRGLKGPMITMLYVKLLSLGYFFLLCSLVGIFVLITGPGWAVLIASVVILGVAGLVLYLYLAMLWSVSIVISVVEDGCYGLQAISKAGEIVRDRRKQGVMLVFIEFVIMAAVYGIYNVVKLHASPSLTSQMGIGVVYVAIGVLASVFELAVSMVFYCDCRRSEEGEVVAIEDSLMYASVPTAAYGEL